MALFLTLAVSKDGVQVQRLLSSLLLLGVQTFHN